MHLYNVPVIQVDLRHEETIIQTANAFEYLDRVIDEVFNKIDGRIRCNNDRIDGINKRIDVANSKINNLTGINKALTIFSPAKYPAATRSIEPTATFTYANRSNIKLSTDYHVYSRFDPISHRDINNKLQFYHVTARTRDDGALHTHKHSLPTHLESIDTVLLFNETVNVYIDEGSDRVRRLEESKMINEQNANNSKTVSATSPLPMLHRKIGAKNKMHEMLFYSPGISEAPQIDVPHDLPDLPGIADDIAFNVTGFDDLAILPNPLNMNIIDLPAISLAESVPSLEKLETISKNIPTTSSVQTTPSSVTVSLPSVQTTQPVILLQPSPPPPPPPPPPLPSLVLANTSSSDNNDSATTIVKSAPKKIIQGESGNLHSSLMAAIRQAGGAGKAKLRASQLRVERTDATIKIPTVPAGDLMADLHNKLAMRRKGISGAKDIESTINATKATATATSIDAGPNLINRISAMIPPPMHGSDSDESDADEWN